MSTPAPAFPAEARVKANEAESLPEHKSITTLLTTNMVVPMVQRETNPDGMVQQVQQVQSHSAFHNHVELVWHLPCGDEWLTFVSLGRVLHQEVVVQLVGKTTRNAGSLLPPVSLRAEADTSALHVLGPGEVRSMTSRE